MSLHFDKSGVVDVDDWKGEFLLKDAPENFTRDLPEQTKMFEVPPTDKAMKRPTRSK